VHIIRERLWVFLDEWMFWGNVIFWENSNTLDDNLKNFQNEGNLWSILFKLNLNNFKLHLKIKNFKFLHCYNLSNFAFWSSNFSKIVIWSLKIFEIYKLTHNFNFQISPKKNKIYKSCLKMIKVVFVGKLCFICFASPQ